MTQNRVQFSLRELHEKAGLQREATSNDGDVATRTQERKKFEIQALSVGLQLFFWNVSCSKKGRLFVPFSMPFSFKVVG